MSAMNTFPKDKQMAIKHMKWYSTSSVTQKMQMETTRYHHIPIRMAKIMTAPNTGYTQRRWVTPTPLVGIKTDTVTLEKCAVS